MSEALKLEEPIIGENNFGILIVVGSANTLELNVKIFDKEGEELWRKSIKSSDLKY